MWCRMLGASGSVLILLSAPSTAFGGAYLVARAHFICPGFWQALVLLRYSFGLVPRYFRRTEKSFADLI